MCPSGGKLCLELNFKTGKYVLFHQSMRYDSTILKIVTLKESLISNT